jgi:hypothetical protein
MALERLSQITESGIKTGITISNASVTGVLTAVNELKVGTGVTINSGIVTATGGFVGNLTGNVTGNVTGNINASGGGSTFNSNVGIQTNDITRSDLVGAGNSFVGLYIGDGFLAFSTSLSRPDGYYISTSINALNAGPVTLGSTMTLDGTWVIV